MQDILDKYKCVFKIFFLLSVLSLFPPSFFISYFFWSLYSKLNTFLNLMVILGCPLIFENKCCKAYEKLCVHELDLSTGELLNEMAYWGPNYFIDVYRNSYSCKSIFRGYLASPENILLISHLRKTWLRVWIMGGCCGT